MNLNVAYPPESLIHLSPAEIDQRIATVRQKLGPRLLILGHHYQQDAIIRHADVIGDSFGLSRAAARSEAAWIVFCGVHFMAETADLVSQPAQKVFLPNPDAGCSLADMADIGQVTRAWRRLTSAFGDELLPITYINSDIALKAFCGEHDGLVCTSANARAALEYGWSRRKHILFFPDQHLGRNIAVRMGVPLEEIELYNPRWILEPGQVTRARLILWNGFCCVHQVFSVEQITALRKRLPELKLIAHPECPFAVVQQADYVGSTEYIIRTVSESPAGSVWGVATEQNLVRRLQARFPDKQIILPSEREPRCRTMAMITPVHLLFQLESIARGEMINQVIVPDELRAPALRAIERMLEL